MIFHHKAHKDFHKERKRAEKQKSRKAEGEFGYSTCGRGRLIDRQTGVNTILLLRFWAYRFSEVTTLCGRACRQAMRTRLCGVSRKQLKH